MTDPAVPNDDQLEADTAEPGAAEEALSAESEEAAASSADEEGDALKAERDQYYQRWVRAQADLENLRRRTSKEQLDASRYRSLDLARDLLPVRDNLERALAAAGDGEAASEATQTLLDGLRMVLGQMDTVFAAHSIVPIETDGQSFDADRHEAISMQPSEDAESMAILQEVEKGYQLHDRVVRPSKVVVAK